MRVFWNRAVTMAAIYSMIGVLALVSYAQTHKLRERERERVSGIMDGRNWCRDDRPLLVK